MGRQLAPLAAVLCLATAAHAQAPAWSLALTGSGTQPTGTSQTRAVATDSRGNVFVAGSFSGTTTFGTTTLTSAGDADIFLAKYVPATNTWAWAQRAGGTYADIAYGIAVSGSSVYLTGSLVNDRSNTAGVLFGGSGTAPGTVVQYGAATVNNGDLFVAKYIDNGSSASVAWTQVAGGTNNDIGYGLAVSGSSVYVTGFLTNSATNASSVLLGGSGTAIGTAQQFGAGTFNSSDLALLKYTDNGATASFVWSQLGGGSGGTETGRAVAVSGSNVYVTGNFVNSTTNANAVVFGGSGPTVGTVQVNGTTTTASADLVLAKYTDNGSTATLGWTQVGGGTDADSGYGVAVSGTSVYVAGSLFNNSLNDNGVHLGGGGTTQGLTPQYGASAVASPDAALLKYTDAGATGTLGWAQVGGGRSNDFAYGVAVSGSSVYVAGLISNNSANAYGVFFGSTPIGPGPTAVNGASSANSYDLLAARYTDGGSTGTFNWAQVGGGTGPDQAFGVALSGQSVWLAGSVTSVATFGSSTISNAAVDPLNALVRLPDTSLTPLATTSAASVSQGLYPNPAARIATLTGAVAGELVQVYDALGRLVLTATATKAGTAALVLPANLPGGLYLVRSGAGPTLRLTVE
ncbi:MAG: T9SS type A sorting domain-containing protein [Janthinobacterium lividum]